MDALKPLPSWSPGGCNELTKPPVSTFDLGCFQALDIEALVRHSSELLLSNKSAHS